MVELNTHFFYFTTANLTVRTTGCLPSLVEVHKSIRVKSKHVCQPSHTHQEWQYRINIIDSLNYPPSAPTPPLLAKASAAAAASLFEHMQSNHNRQSISDYFKTIFARFVPSYLTTRFISCPGGGAGDSDSGGGGSGSIAFVHGHRRHSTGGDNFCCLPKVYVDAAICMSRVPSACLFVFPLPLLLTIWFRPNQWL